MPWPADVPAADPVRCPATTVEVSTSAAAATALRDAAPGTVIGLADGMYDGTFTAAAQRHRVRRPSGCAAAGDAVLRGPGTDDGTVLHLAAGPVLAAGRVHRPRGPEGRHGRRHQRHACIQDLTVTEIGDEAVHLRAHSTDNVVRGLTVSDTG